MIKYVMILASENVLYFGARYYNSDISVWLSVDPLADKHPDYSPYSYVYNNPLNLVDPWSEDSIQLNRDGSTNIIATTKDDFDVYVATDKKGNLDKSKTHILYDKDVSDKRTNEVEYNTGKQDNNGNDIYAKTDLDEYDIKDYDVAKDFFEFAADNTDVEWSHNIVGNSNRSIITTSHLKDSELGGGFLLQNGYTLEDRRHSHPYNQFASPSDMNNVRDYYKKKFPNMLNYIYHKGNYYQFNENRTSLAPNQTPKTY